MTRFKLLLFGAVAVGIAIGVAHELSDSSPSFSEAPRAVASLTLTGAPAQTFSGKVYGLYVATNRDSDCKRTPRVFGLIPQHRAAALKEFVELKVDSPRPGVLQASAPAAKESKCNWRFSYFVPSISIDGTKASMATPLVSPGQTVLDYQLSCFDPKSKAGSIVCTQGAPEFKQLFQINVNVKYAK